MSILDGSDPFPNFLVLTWSTSVTHMETGLQQGLEELFPFLIFKLISHSSRSSLFSGFESSIGFPLKCTKLSLSHDTAEASRPWLWFCPATCVVLSTHSREDRETPAKSWPPFASTPNQGAPKLGSSSPSRPLWTKPLLHSTSEEAMQAWFYPIQCHIEYLWIYFLCATCDWKTNIWWNLRWFQAHSCKQNTQQILDISPCHTQDQTKPGMPCKPHCAPGTDIQVKNTNSRDTNFKYHIFFLSSCIHLYFLACLLHGNSPMCLSFQNRTHLAFLKWLHINISTLAVDTCKCHCLSQLTVSLSKEDNVVPWERSQGWTALFCTLCVFLSNWDGQ